MAEVTKAETMRTGLRHEFWLWVGLLLPPIVWAVQLQTIYLTSEYGCATSRFFWNHAVSAALLLLSLGSLAISWFQWRSYGATTEDEGGTPIQRKRFMAILGMLTAFLFSLLIVAQWLPTILEVPCDK